MGNRLWKVFDDQTDPDDHNVYQTYGSETNSSSLRFLHYSESLEKKPVGDGKMTTGSHAISAFMEILSLCSRSSAVTTSATCGTDRFYHSKQAGFLQQKNCFILNRDEHQKK